MRMCKRAYGLCAVALFSILFFSCSRRDVGGSVEMLVIKNKPGVCQYEVGPVTINTLSSLYEMKGLMGQVVYHPKDLDSDAKILELGEGFKRVDIQFNRSGGTYGPVDLVSLFSASLYWAMETGYSLFRRLDPTADMAQLIPKLSDTKIVYNANAKVDDKKKEIQDNAAYLGLQNPNTGEMLNYFLAFPTDKIQGIPLGLNLGVFVHEYTHMAVQHLLYTKLPSTEFNLETEHTIGAFDEGTADYMGFLATQDPSFFNCSFPEENRNLAVAKAFDADHVSKLKSSSDYDIHEGGAVWAAALFEIGQAIQNHEIVGQSLAKLIPFLAECPEANLKASSATMRFSQIAKCHRRIIDGRYQSSVDSIYRRILGPYSGEY